MSDEAVSLLSFDVPFEPDIIAEEELADEDEQINKQLISDITIRRCRLLISLRSVEYGIVSSAPGALLVFSFNFHPFETRFKNARIRLRFESDSEVIVTALQPDSIIGTEDETTIQSKLRGRFRLGYGPLELVAEGELSGIRKYAMNILGTGVDSDAAVWTLQENHDQRHGIPLNLIAAVALRTRGGINIDLDIRAKLGSLGIRKVIAQKSIKLDGQSTLGRRPDDMEVSEEVFCRGTVEIR